MVAIKMRNNSLNPHVIFNSSSVNKKESYNSAKKFKESVVYTLKESEEEKNLTKCKDVNDMFRQLDI
jgi:hypothetical protein